MGELFKVRDVARADIVRIAEFIAEDNPVAAFDVVEDFYELFALLGTQPKMGSRV